MKKLWEEIQFLKGVGPQRSRSLQRLGIKTIFDLIWHVPRTYFNRNQAEKIAALTEGTVASLRGSVITTKQNRTKRGFHILKAKIEDDSGIITAIWFNQPYLFRQLKTGQEVFLSGKVKNTYGEKEIIVSEYEFLDGEKDDLLIVPIYSLTEGINQKTMRNIMLNALSKYLPSYRDIMDNAMRQHYDVCTIQFAFRNIHFPESGEAYLMARRRLALEELLLFKLSLYRTQDNEQIPVLHHPEDNLVGRVIDGLPFMLTEAQQRVVNEILQDMEKPAVMNRLLQGDVGSGKTIVAALAMAQAVASGYQAAIMVPTEILAEQHFMTLGKIFRDTEVQIACLTGNTNVGERNMILAAIAAGEINVLVGTHALIQEQVCFKNLGLAVIDEQHRFGVRQRLQLGNKGQVPDMLVMTATPIPRTLALALYGDLQVSVIDQLPPGRRPVKTAFIPKSSRGKAYSFIRIEIEKGAQAYIVCPIIEQSETQDLQAAVTLHEELRDVIYPDLRVGLLHGRMKAPEKEYIMERLKKGQIDVLVTTTVVEVGIDVANVSVMLIEHAERFGISQLHQLRGRVGRGERQSYCILVGEPKTDDAVRRLQAMVKTNDGFELANQDLLIRGPGDFWGVKQHGLHELKVANLLQDQQILTLAAEAAEKFNNQLIQDRELDQYISLKYKHDPSMTLN